jgi:hypothetical protein
MAPSLDDIIRTKAIEAQETARKEAERKVEEARSALSQRVVDLSESRKKLLSIKERLSKQQEETLAASTEKSAAEKVIDTKAAKLEAFGISKDQILNDPALQATEEVQRFTTASERDQFYSSLPKSHYDAEINQELADTGIEMADFKDESEVTRAIENRLQEIEKEQTAAVSEVIAEYGLKLDPIEVTRDTRYPSPGSSFVEVNERLQAQLHKIPDIDKAPEVRDAVVRQLIMGAILEKNQEYQNRKAAIEKQEAEKREVQEAHDMLPAYLEFLNEHLYQPIQAQLDTLHENVREYFVRSNTEMQALSKLLCIENGKVTGLNLNVPTKEIAPGVRGALPTPESMKRQMTAGESTLPWNRNSSLSFALEGLKNLSKIPPQYARSQFRDALQGNVSSIIRVFERTETVIDKPRYGLPPLDDFENDAKEAADSFVHYRSLVEESTGPEWGRILQERDQVRRKREQLMRSEKIPDVTFSIEGGKVTNLVVESSIKNYSTQKTAIERKLAELKERVIALGERPTGHFLVQKKQEKWDKSKAKLDNAISEINKEISYLGLWLKDANADWSKQLNLPAEVLAEFDGRTVGAATLRYKLLMTFDQEHRGIEQAAFAVESKRNRLRELGSGGFRGFKY